MDPRKIIVDNTGGFVTNHTVHYAIKETMAITDYPQERFKKAKWKLHPVQAMAIINFAASMILLKSEDLEKSISGCPWTLAGYPVEEDLSMPESEIHLDIDDGKILVIIRQLAVPNEQGVKRCQEQ
jgi:hypothetical protein